MYVDYENLPLVRCVIDEYASERIKRERRAAWNRLREIREDHEKWRREFAEEKREREKEWLQDTIRELRYREWYTHSCARCGGKARLTYTLLPTISVRAYCSSCHFNKDKTYNSGYYATSCWNTLTEYDKQGTHSEYENASWIKAESKPF